jgi:hypothetical protein
LIQTVTKKIKQHPQIREADDQYCNPGIHSGDQGHQPDKSAVGTIHKSECKPFFLRQEQVAKVSGIWTVPDGTHMFRFAEGPRDESLGYKIGRSYTA